MVSVTWNLNMTNETVAAEGPSVAGGTDFGFPGDNPMSDSDGDGIWTLTTEVASGYTGYYTFTNGACGDWSCKENIAGQDCANPVIFNNRQLENITEDTVINTCFGQCSTDGSCNAPNPCDENCFGCTEPSSCNYDSDATVNDGSCVWNQNIDSGFRYIHNVFDEVVVSQDVAYGTNISIITTTLGMPPAPENLLLDIYEPAYDTLEERPLLLYFHTGNFLPQYANGSAVGKKNDSCAVAICTEFAKKGYVVASCDYRIGWSPVAATQEERASSLVQAIYRGVQDSRTAVRFFRKSQNEDGNPYRIDGDKIGMIGDGTGGYITLASATINNYADIILDDLGQPITKFYYDPGDGSSIPMVIEDIHGDPDATTDTFAPASSGGFQLCMANHLGYSSDFNFQMNLGGALGDLNWLDEGDVPMVSFQCPHDPFVPYETAVLVVLTTNEPLVEVSGAYDIHSKINGYATNNNAVFAEIGLSDPATALGNQGWDGLYPIMNNYNANNVPTEPFDASPWQWWSEAALGAYDDANGTSYLPTQLILNPTMGPTEALDWIYQIVDYVSIRMALSLSLVSMALEGTPCDDGDSSTSNDVWLPGCVCEGEPTGCNDPEACNYDSSSDTNNGCEFESCLGCTDPAATNYNPIATVDNGSCAYPVSGCTEPEAVNYDPLAAIDDGSCFFDLGCSDIGTGLFESQPLGLYPLQSAGMVGIPMNTSIALHVPSTIEEEGTGFFYGVQSFVPDYATSEVPGISLPDLPGTMMGNHQACLELVGTPTAAGTYQVELVGELYIFIFGSPFLAGEFTLSHTVVIEANPNPIAGCMYVGATNYSPLASVDEGACIIPGCMDDEAVNYHPVFTQDDGTCVFDDDLGGSTCPSDLNGDELVGVADLLILLGEFDAFCTP